MKLNVTIDDIYYNMQVYWEVAHTAPSYGDWMYRWHSVENQIQGIWIIVNHCYEGRRSAELEELLDEITFLKKIAFENHWNGDV